MNEDLIFILTIIFRFLLAGGCLFLGFKSLGYGWDLISNGKNHSGRTNFNIKWGELEAKIGANTVGGLVICISFLWGFPAYLIAPVYKSNGREVALNLRPNSLNDFVVAIDNVNYEDLIKNPTILQTQYSQALEKKKKDWQVKDSEAEDVDYLAGKRVIKVDVESERQTAEIKYLPVKKNGSVEMYPLEVAVQNKEFPENALLFTCNTSIQAYLKKAKAGNAPDIKTHRNAILRMCKKDIEKLQEEEKKLFLLDQKVE